MLPKLTPEQLAIAIRQLSEEGYNIASPKKKKKNKKKRSVPIVFEDSPKGVRLDRIADLFPKKEKKEKKKKEKKKKEKYTSPITFESERAEKMRLNIQHRRELLDQAIDLGYNPKNRRIPGKAELDSYIAENQKAYIIFKKYPKLKKERDYKLVLSFYGEEITKETALDKKNKKSKRKGLQHIIQVDGDSERFYKEITVDYVIEVKSKLNLIKLLQAGGFIKHYDGKKETPEWEELMYLIDQTGVFTSRTASILNLIEYIKIDTIQKDLSSKQTLIPIDYIEKKKQRDDSDMTLCHSMIDLDYDIEKAKLDIAFLFKPVFDVEYLNSNFKKGACFLSMIIEAYSTSWNKYQNTEVGVQNHQLLTYEYLENLFNLEDTTDLGVTFQTAIDKFFEPNRLGLTVYDLMGSVIIRHQPITRNKRLSPCNLRCVTSNGHVQLINSKRGLKILAKLEDIKDEDLTIKVSDQFHLTTASKKAPIPHYLIEDFSNLNTLDFQNMEEKMIKVTTTTPLTAVLSLFVNEYKYLPKNISQYGHDLISGIYFKVYDVEIDLKNPDSDMILGELDFQSQEQFDVYQSSKKKLERSLVNMKTLSSYKEIELLRYFSPKAIVCSIEKSLLPTHYVDIIKAYTSCLLSINKLPQVNQFDRFIPFQYEESGIFSINISYLYLIERTSDVSTIPPILLHTILPNKYTIYRGEEISRLHSVMDGHFTILAEMKISNLSDNKSGPVAEEIYSSILSEKQRKFIFNATLGTMEKIQNKKKKIVLIKDFNEALIYARRYDAKMYPFVLEGDKTLISDYNNHPLLTQRTSSLYTVSKEEKKELINGMYPCKLYVYSLMRYKLYLMYKKVIDIGGVPTAIHTDCVFFHSDNEVKENKIDTKIFKNIGKYKWRMMGPSDIPPKSKFIDKTVKKSELINNILSSHLSVLQTIDNEKFWKTEPMLYESEAFEKLDQNKYNLIEGSQAGTGKTHLSKAYLKHCMLIDDSNCIAIAPSNKRVIELRKSLGEDKAMTLHQLLQMRLDGEEVISNKSFSKKSILPSIDLLFIDEIYAFDVSSLSNIKSKIMDRFPNMRVIAAGDAVQSRVSDVKVDNVDDYYRTVVNSMFSTGISLSINKRMDSEVEQQKIEEIKKVIFHSKSDVPIPHIGTFDKMTDLYNRHFNVDGEFTGKVVTYHVDTGDVVGKLIHCEYMKQNRKTQFTKVNGMYLYSGQELVNRDHRVVNGKTLYVNYSYVVEEVETSLIEKRGQDKFGKNGRGNIEWVESQVVHMTCPFTHEKFFIPAKSIESFRYSYCNTIHSSQGDTYDSVPLSLFDFDSFWIKSNDKYTAISRTNKTELVQIYTGQSMKIDMSKLKEKITRRIDSHKSVDLKANRPFTEEEYITVDWVLNKFNSTNFTCPHCRANYGLTNGTSMKDFSVDRIDNSFAHTQANCVIGCRSCNVADRKSGIRS
jgi:hypothetical protein